MTPALLALAFIAAAPAPKEKAKLDPSPVGVWAPESVTVNGQPTQPGADCWEFRTDGSWAMSRQGQPVAAGTFTHDPKASPPSLDLLHNGQTNLCLLKIEGDLLTMSVGHDPTQRPADLQPGRKVTVWVFKRVKEK